MMQYHLKIGTRDYIVDVGDISAGKAQVSVNSKIYDIEIKTDETVTPPEQSSMPVRKRQDHGAVPEKPKPAAPRAETPAGAPGSVLAPIPGLILDVKVAVGDSVTAGQTVATMEAMKMENDLTTKTGGTVTKILVQKGSEVATGDVIMTIG